MTIVAKTETANAKPIKKNWEHERQRDRKMVRGKFMFHDMPGGVLSFNYQMYKGDPVERFNFKDGGIYEVPFGVAKHLNKVGTPVHEFQKDEQGKPLMKITSFQKRCSFQSLDFLGEDDFDTPDLFKAEIVTDLVK